jgi:hypothetical protein
LLKQLELQQPEHIESGVVSQIYSLSHFPVDLLTPEFVSSLFYNYPSADQIGAQKRKFEQAEEIFVPCNSMGLGDCIINLVYACGLAVQFKNKRFTLEVSEPISLMNSLKLPPNCRLTTQIEPSEALYFIPGFLDNYRFKGPNIMQLSRRLGEIKQNQSTEYNLGDAIHYGKVMALGQHCSEVLVNTPIINPENQEEKVFDFLLVPDAKELEIKNESRSRKSFSEEKWGEIVD